MTYRDFTRLVTDASEFSTLDDYIAEVGGSVSPEIPDSRLVPVLNACWDYAHDRSSASIRGISGLSRAAFAREYMIPIRTLECWESSAAAAARRAPGYVLDLIAYAVISGIAAQ